MKNKIRIVHVMGSMGVGGIESLLMTIMKKLDPDKFAFDFLVHRIDNPLMKEQIESLGGRVFTIDKLNPLKPWVYLNDLDKFFDKHKEIKILHNHFRGTEALILRKAKAHGLVTISHNHGIQNSSKLKNFIRNLFKGQVMKYSDYRFACSDEAGRDLYGASYVKINNGIDLDKFRFSDKLRDEIRKEFDLCDKFVLLNVASLMSVKNQSFLIEIMPELVEKNPKTRLIFLGNGPDENMLKDKARELGVSDFILFLPSSNRVGAYLSAADLFLFPSLREGLGIAAMEAQASGLKVLASDRIPKEVGISPYLKFLPLEKAKWIREILDTMPYDRLDFSKEISDAGYNIASTVSYLSDFYQSISL